jgi:hypothetical protein
MPFAAAPAACSCGWALLALLLLLLLHVLHVLELHLLPLPLLLPHLPLLLLLLASLVMHVPLLLRPHLEQAPLQPLLPVLRVQAQLLRWHPLQTSSQSPDAAAALLQQNALH